MVCLGRVFFTSRDPLFNLVRPVHRAPNRKQKSSAHPRTLHQAFIDLEVVMPKTAFQLNLKKPPEDAHVKTHNRWHPDIPMVETFKPGAEFRVECFDWTGGQIFNDDSANDVRDVDLTKVHYLSGPFGVEGAEPGDLLVVDLLDIGYLPDSPWGFTGIFAKENGGGFLVDHYAKAHKACWDFHGIYTTSRHIPGVRWAGLVHPGLIGCLPNRELLERANKREAELLATNPNRVPPLVAP